MVHQWMFKSETYDNCNCAVNCGCQFNLPTTHGYCQSAFVGTIVEGHFDDTPLAGLNWAGLYKWPGEIAEGGGRRQIVIDERRQAPDRHRRAFGRVSAGRARGDYLWRGRRAAKQPFLGLRDHLCRLLRDTVPADHPRGGPREQNGQCRYTGRHEK
jgi:hypothetical protein